MLDKSPRPATVNVPNDLAAHWMPFTANRAFKKAPRLLAGAKDMHYFTVDGRSIIDAASGMWCTNAGHGRAQIAAAIAQQAATLDFAPPFQFGIPQAFELASRIADLAPEGLDDVVEGEFEFDEGGFVLPRQMGLLVEAHFGQFFFDFHHFLKLQPHMRSVAERLGL